MPEERKVQFIHTLAFGQNDHLFLSLSVPV